MTKNVPPFFWARINLHIVGGAMWSCCRCCGTKALCARLFADSSSSSSRPGVQSLSRAHRCAKPLEYPCAGEARTDHRGGPSLSSRQKGKNHGESMAVEEEGLRVFQSVKIKIGKRKKSLPPSLSASMDGSILTGRAVRQAVRDWDRRGDRTVLFLLLLECKSHAFLSAHRR